MSEIYQTMNLSTQQSLEAEIVAHIAACSHELPKTAFIDYDNNAIANELKKHSIDVKCAGASHSVLECATSDIVITHALPNTSLSSTVILIRPMPSLYDDFESAYQFLQVMSKDFAILMPFAVWGMGKWFVFASQRFHPIASLQLQRADMLDDLQWYCAHLHQSAFVLPCGIAQKLRCVVRN